MLIQEWIPIEGFGLSNEKLPYRITMSADGSIVNICFYSNFSEQHEEKFLSTIKEVLDYKFNDIKK